MTGCKKIEYKNGLRKLVRRQFPNLKLNPDSGELLSNILNEINGQLVKEFDEEYKSKPSMTEEDVQLLAQKAVGKIFKGSLKKHAISEAQRQITLFETGCMKYDSEMEIEKVKTKLQKSTAQKLSARAQTAKAPPSFTTCLGKLVKSVNSHPDLNLDKRALEYMSSQLRDFTSKIARRAAVSAANREELQPLDLRPLLAEFLGEDVMKIANSEGNRSLALHGSGLIIFRAKQPASKVESQSKEMENTENFGKLFRNGIKRYLAEFNQELSLDPKGSKGLENILMDVARYLSSAVAETCQLRDIKEIGDGEVNQAATELFSGALQEHALIQGNVDIKQYVDGYLKYKRKPTVTKEDRPKSNAKQSEKSVRRSGESAGHKRKRSGGGRSKMVPKKRARQAETPKISKRQKTHPPVAEKKASAPKRTRETRLDFTTGLLDASRKNFPSLNISLNKVTTKGISEILVDVCNKLIEEGVQDSQRSDLGPNDMKNAMKKIFPRELAEHAESYGAIILASSWVNEPPVTTQSTPSKNSLTTLHKMEL